VQRYVANNQVIYNGAKAEMYGADLDAELVITHGLSISGGFSYIHDQFISFLLADYIVPVGGCTPPPGGVCSASAAGNKLAVTPTTTFNIGGDYKIDTNFGEVALNATYYRTGKYFAAPDNIAFQPAYDLVNASIAWTNPAGHLSVRLWGKNLGNTIYTTSLIEGFSGLDQALGYPRTYGVTAGLKF
jgi:iron complex outermembrane receptor protein